MGAFAIIEGDVTVRDSSGVELAIAAGASLGSTKALLQAVSDGGVARMRSGDSSGRAYAVGAAAHGATVLGNPVLVAGSDGSNAYQILTDSSGRQIVTGAAPSGSAVAGNPVLSAGFDGTNARTIRTDTPGRLRIVGAASSGNPAAGDPVLVAGSDGTNAQTVRTAADGTVRIDPTGTTTQPTQDTSSLVDNAGFTDGTSRIIPVGFVFDEAAGTALTENDIAAGRIDSKRALVFALEDETTRGRRQTVKAASTGCDTTDKPAVVIVSQNRAATYTGVAALTSATSPTDIATLTGSASKTIRVTRVFLRGSMAASVQLTIFLIKRSAANTGGTSTTPTITPHDSGFAAATAVFRTYTVNPTGLGAAVGNVRADRVMFPGSGTDQSFGGWDFSYTDIASPVILRGTSQLLCVNLNGILLSTPSFTVGFEWVEET